MIEYRRIETTGISSLYTNVIGAQKIINREKHMEVNVQSVSGNWDLGYSLDKHVLNSVYVGENQWGHPEFETTRTEVGEALYQLKYRFAYKQVANIATQLYDSLSSYFIGADLIIPMPPSKKRVRQPVIEIARLLAHKMELSCVENVLVKRCSTPQMKDIESREKKVETLINAFSVNDNLGNDRYNILLIDDLFDTGSTLEAATAILRGYAKIQHIYVAAVTRKR